MNAEECDQESVMTDYVLQEQSEFMLVMNKENMLSSVKQLLGIGTCSSQ